MPIIAKSSGGGDFEPAPEGLHRAVCVDVIDLGIMDTQWGKKPKIRLVFQTEDKDKDGRRFQVRHMMNLSVHPTSTAYKFLVSWRGKAFTAEEQGVHQTTGFDFEQLIGKTCMLQVIHAVKDGGRVYANIQAIMPDSKNDPLVAEDYTRSVGGSDGSGGNTAANSDFQGQF